MSWRSEFGDDYEVPSLVGWLASQGFLKDISWHNDAAPSFAVVDPGDEGFGVRLWVDHPVRRMREFGAMGAKRFTVQEGEFIGESEFERDTDDLEEALTAMVERALRPRYASHKLHGLPWVKDGGHVTSRRPTGHSWSPRRSMAGADAEVFVWGMVDAWLGRGGR